LRLLVTTFFVLYLGLGKIAAQIAEIPFDLKNDIILIELKVNDHESPKAFVFDTGASYDVLDKGVAASLGLKANYKQEARGAGGAQSVDIVQNQRFMFNNLVVAENSNVVLLDLSRLRRKLERNFDGIIGYSLISKHVTKIDYDNQKILLYNNIQEVNTDSYTRIPFQFMNGIPIPQLDITITLKNNHKYHGTVFFDSGAALTLSVNTPYNKRHKLNKKVNRLLVSETENLNSKSISKDITIKSMTLGGYNLDEMVISLANDKEGVSSYKGYLGILGAKVISRFNFILDYSSSTLYIKPNAKFSEPFEFPLSGLTLKKDNGNIVISRVQENCEAWQKGVRQGDRLVAINSITGKDIDFYRELLKEEGKTCRLVLIDSTGKSKEAHITLKRLL
jgi:hypothetical protein